MVDKIVFWFAKAFNKPLTIPDGDGGRCTYYPSGKYSHKV